MELWKPQKLRLEESNLYRFMRFLERESSQSFSSFEQLHAWSIKESASFWSKLWSFCEIKSYSPWRNVVSHTKELPGAVWFEGATLNFAENLLNKVHSKTSITFRGEGRVKRELNNLELNTQISSLAAHLRSLGITEGDRIAAYIPNIPEAIVGMLAAASIGAIWSSCSPDFGVSGVLDRFSQIEPKILLGADGYFFKDKPIDCLANVKEIVAALPSLKETIIIPYTSPAPNLTGIPNAKLFSDTIKNEAPHNFARLPFNHPLYIMFSSGTTGKPKCIVHSAGGTLLEQLKELILHTDLKPGDKLLYHTTCGWMMWNWMVGALGAGSSLVLYDGSPLCNNGKILFDILDDEQVSVFGTSAKFISLIEKEGLRPQQTHKLQALHTILSTGSPLLPESFDYVYRDIKSDVCLSSIAGGTDILGCFTLGAPGLPVFRGETQSLSLGMDVQVFNEKGEAITGEKGELICANKFPSMPLGFWNDPGQEKYRAAYFERFPGVWHHGDFVEMTPRHGLIYFGRSDTVLNPGGVRIGSSEIYRQVETLPEILESIVVGQDHDGDVRVVLFVRLKENRTLTDSLKDRIKTTIRKNASPFHVPKIILQVNDIPRTRSGKIAETAVREAIHGRAVKNTEALANPESLREYTKID